MNRTMRRNKKKFAMREYSRWSHLPDLILEIIFSYLTIKERYNCSLVCKSWYRAFSLPYVWSRFTLKDSTRRKNQCQLDHQRYKRCLFNIGNRIKHLIFSPMYNIHTLYNFMHMVSKKVKYGMVNNIETLKFTGPCGESPIDEYEGVEVPETYGIILDELKELLEKLNKLKRRELIDLMLHENEAKLLLKNVSRTLRTLIVVNTTIMQYPLLDVGKFPNLYQLVISPQNLGDNVVKLIGKTKLRHLHILQTTYSPDENTIIPVSTKAWKSCKNNNPLLSVHLQMNCSEPKLMVWQESAPVRSILYGSSHFQINSDEIMTVIDNYSQYLKTYGHLGLISFHKCKSFHKRADSNLLLLVRECPLLSTLVVNERISTETVLLLASTGSNLRRLYIRKKPVIIKSDWERSPDWTDGFFAWLKIRSCYYDIVEEEVSYLLGYKWKFMSDEDFLNLNIDLHNP